MSDVIINEPATNGKVCLVTTVGDIEIELWSKECPKACRNFVTLCMKGYYDNTIFHRLEPGLIVQGGDPTGTGCGGESAFGGPFKDEYHTRLRFSRRGLVAMAGGKNHLNGSQFFFTLNKTPEFQNRHTLFGKVNKATLVNMLRLGESEVDKRYRPLYPEKILRCYVISNPFPEIVPPPVSAEPKGKKAKPAPKEMKKRNLSLLSFGEEAKEEEESLESVNKKLFLRGKSAHDVIADNKSLSSTPVLSTRELNRLRGDSEATMYASSESEKKKQDSAIANRLKLLTGDSAKTDNEDAASDDEDLEEMLGELKRDQKKARLEQIKQEYRALRKELAKGSGADDGDGDSDKKPLKPHVADYFAERDKYKVVSTAARGSTERERETLKILEKFQSKLKAAHEIVIEKGKCVESDESDDDVVGAWMTHKFVAPVVEPEVKGSRPQDKDMFFVEDMRMAAAPDEAAAPLNADKGDTSSV
uniref:Spliceosome-associated protein CWC27 homolog n=1 Tax=Trichuris muris TaxID=70415 RepID=A0A5S6QFD5_TRIMR